MSEDIEVLHIMNRHQNTKFFWLFLYRHENDEDFLTQIVVFDEQKQQDDDMMVTGDGLDLNDHQQVFRAVFDQVRCFNCFFVITCSQAQSIAFLLLKRMVSL